jgi:hypothetical protein
VSWTSRSLARTVGREATILPNIGGSLPNDIFADVLHLKTIWVPHSYAGCSQHAPNEHLLAPIAREGLGLMAGLFWDLRDVGTLPTGQTPAGKEWRIPSPKPKDLSRPVTGKSFGVATASPQRPIICTNPSRPL